MSENLNCPFCAGVKCAEEKVETRTHIVKNNVYSGEFIFYQCLFCKEKFTTTASDEISLKRFKPKKK